MERKSDHGFRRLADEVRPRTVIRMPSRVKRTRNTASTSRDTLPSARSAAMRAFASSNSWHRCRVHLRHHSASTAITAARTASRSPGGIAR